MLSLSSMEFEVPIVASKLNIAKGSIFRSLKLSIEITLSRLDNLSPEADLALEQHLTPAVKGAIGELFGPEIMQMVQDIGPEQPTVSLPVGIIASAYPADTIEQSIQMMEQDFRSKAQADIPDSPQGGLGGAPEGAPQTNVPPSTPMMA